MDHRSLQPYVQPWRGHIWWVLHLWLRFITFGGRSARSIMFTKVAVKHQSSIKIIVAPSVGCLTARPPELINYLSNSIYSYFSIAVSFFKAILYKLYNPIVTVFKGQFLHPEGVTKRLLLKLFSLIAIKRLTSALKQTVIVRYSFGNVKTMLTFSNLT